MVHTTNHMVSAVFLIALSMAAMVSSTKFPSLPAFRYNKIESASSYRRNWISSAQQETMILSFRGGAEETNDEDAEEDDSNDDEVEVTDPEESSEDESDEDDYYDDETTDEEEEEETALASQLKNTVTKDKSDEPFVEPYFISPSLQMYTTFGTILLSRKIDMFNPKIVRLIRFCFVLHLIVQQAFIFYVRVMAKRNNDRTPVSVENPLTSMLSSQLEKQQAGANDMVKNLASSFLKKESTIAEYDMGQAMNMQGGILFNMALMWFLHFKMQQVQPLLVTTINGFLQLFYNPLFQVYVLGRNLERPFKAPEVLKDPRVAAAEEEKATESTTAEEEYTECVDEETDTDGDEEDESSDDDEEEGEEEEDEAAEDSAEDEDEE